MKSIYSISDWRHRPCIRYQTKWASVHSIARCLRGGQNRKCGLSTHSLEICLGSARSIIATRRRVQSQMAGPLSHSIKRCINVSGLPHCLHVSDSTRCIAARRSLVGISSYITKYHADWTACDTHDVCRFHHTLSQSVFGLFWATRISIVLLVASSILCSVIHTSLEMRWRFVRPRWYYIGHVQCIVP
jgi:hypothetical protein